MENILAALPIPSSHVLDTSIERDRMRDSLDMITMNRSDGLPEGGTVPACRRLLLCRQVCIQGPVRSVADLRRFWEECESWNYTIFSYELTGLNLERNTA